MKHKDDIYLLLARHLGGTATPQETAAVQDWLAESAANRAFFAAMVSAPKVDTDAAWNKVNGYMRHNPNRFYWLRPVLRYAAAAVVIFGVAIFAWTKYNDLPPQIQVVAQNIDVAGEHILQDNSSVFLNKDSRLAHVGNYGNGTRELQLTGEAFFEVASSDEGQFLVHAEEALIKDIGTAFNVQAYPASDSITVFVQSGEVQFYTALSEGIVLHAGETGIFDKRTKAFTRTATDANTIAYKTRLFVFQNTPLNKAIADLCKVYNVHIALADPALAAQTISVTFDNESIEEIVEIIEETLDLRSLIPEGGMEQNMWTFTKK
ncbi:anti-sigma factor [Bacteroidia bacterium]|nr:anti-sigma factor [Bacteroidia bacterium]